MLTNVHISLKGVKRGGGKKIATNLPNVNIKLDKKINFQNDMSNA